jgi:hypothetical protein
VDIVNQNQGGFIGDSRRRQQRPGGGNETDLPDRHGIFVDPNLSPPYVQYISEIKRAHKARVVAILMAIIRTFRVQKNITHPK